MVDSNHGRAGVAPEERVPGKRAGTQFWGGEDVARPLSRFKVDIHPKKNERGRVEANQGHVSSP